MAARLREQEQEGLWAQGRARGDHVALEVTLPQFEAPLYFLGEVMRTDAVEDGVEIACRFDWIGSSDGYREKLDRFLSAHGLPPTTRPA